MVRKHIAFLVFPFSQYSVGIVNGWLPHLWYRRDFLFSPLSHCLPPYQIWGIITSYILVHPDNELEVTFLMSPASCLLGFYICHACTKDMVMIDITISLRMSALLAGLSKIKILLILDLPLCTELTALPLLLL